MSRFTKTAGISFFVLVLIMIGVSYMQAVDGALNLGYPLHFLSYHGSDLLEPSFYTFDIQGALVDFGIIIIISLGIGIMAREKKKPDEKRTNE